MCGIAALLSKRKSIEVGVTIDSMLAAQKHRGPDAEGVYTTDFLRIGMVRLSIIDLKSQNLCPLVYKPPGKSSPTHVLSYNGELYNYKELRQELETKGHIFTTSSDTEVLLHSYIEWGEDCLDKFNGMFAFALADFEKNLMFLARDIAGEKPLYYWQDSERFLVASEIKAILTKIPLPEVNFTEEFQAFEYMTGEETLFKGVQALRPGHSMVVAGICGDYRETRIHEYWRVNDHLEDLSPDRAVDRLDELLCDSVAIRLRADVPLGLYLSGGLDSSLLAGIAKPKIVFSVTSDQGPKYDELAYAQLMARSLNCEQVVIRPNKDDFEKYLDEVIYHLDVLTGSFSAFPLYMLAKEASKHVKIVLSGEGADELFSGYTRYLLPHHDSSAYQIPELANYHALLNYYYGSSLDRFAHLLNRGLVPDKIVREVIAPYFNEFQDLRHAMGYTEFKTMLITLLHMEDRAASAFGIENRSPFLDKRIISFAFSIPGDMKIRENTTKWIVRQVARRYVPAEIVDRKTKLGLILPINIWLKFSGQRGEFDRQDFNRLCMERWRKIFYQEQRFKNYSALPPKNSDSGSGHGLQPK